MGWQTRIDQHTTVKDFCIFVCVSGAEGGGGSRSGTANSAHEEAFYTTIHVSDRIRTLSTNNSTVMSLCTHINGLVRKSKMR